MIKFKNFIWDWNGTLVNDVLIACKVVNALGEKRGVKSLSFSDYQNIYTHPIQKIYERAGFNFELESFESLAEEWHSKYLKESLNIELHSDSKESLQRLKDLNARQFILSALPHEILCRSVEHQKIAGYFEYVLGLEDSLAVSKINNGHILMKKAGLIPEETILIGDSSHDLETAEALGITSAIVARGYESKERLLARGIVVYEDFSTLLNSIIE